MILGPLLFRVAGWPLETISDLQSAGFTKAVDDWILEEYRLSEAAAALSDEMFRLVPLLTDRRFRAEVLGLRRALHRNSDPVEIPEGLSGPLLQRLNEHSAQRTRHSDQKAFLTRQYEQVFQTELAALRKIVSRSDFQKALCLASPSAYQELLMEKPVNLRLTRTLLQFTLRAVGRPTPNGLWAGVGIESGSCDEGVQIRTVTSLIRFAPRLAYFADAFRAASPDDDFPVVYEDAWEALSILVKLVSASDSGKWNHTLNDLHCLCLSMADSFPSMSPRQFQSGLNTAREIMNGLRTHYGLGVVKDDECVLVADYIAPFQFRVSAGVRQQISTALRNTWQFDRLGAGERDAAAKRSGGSHEPDLTTCWESELEPVCGHPRHHLANTCAQSRPVSPGSALVRLDCRGELAIRVGCIAPDPALFYGRFHYLFRDAGTCDFAEWYRSEIIRIEAGNPDLLFADLGLNNPSDLNAAAKPRFSSLYLDSAMKQQIVVAAGGDGFPFLRVKNRQPAIVPLVSSAVSLHTSDDDTRNYAEVMHLLGRPSLLRPLPLLPKERDSWKHLPRLELEGGTTIGAERWLAPSPVLSQLTSLSGLNRFIEWRRYVVSNRLPDLVYAITGLENTESLLPCRSVLAVEAMARSIKGKAVQLRLQEAYPDPRESWLQAPDGTHYLCEIAAAWAGEEEFWHRYSTQCSRAREVSHVC